MSREFVVFALRNLWARPLRTLLTALGIVLGVAVILAIEITNQSTLAAVERVLEEASGKAHLVVESGTLSGGELEERVVARIEKVAGVQRAVPSLLVSTLPVEKVEEWQYHLALSALNLNTLWIYGIDPALDQEARVYRLVEGRFLEAGEEENNLVLVESYAQENEISVGEELALLTPSGSEGFTVVGLIAEEGIGATNSGTVGLAPLGAVQEAFARQGEIDRVDVVVVAEIAKDPQRLEELRQRLQEELGEKFTVVYPAPRGKLFTQMLASYNQGLTFFSAIALFVGGFLIYNTFSMTVVERSRDIGLLRAVGATRRQVLGTVLLEALLLGSLGSLLGVFFGLFLARGLMWSQSSLLGVKIPEVTIPPSGLLQSLLVGLGVTLASALLPARQASQVSPLEALRLRAATQRGRLLEKGWILGLAVVLLAWLFLGGFLPLRQEMVYVVGSASIFTFLLGTALLVPTSVNLLEKIFRPVFRRIYGGEGMLGASNVRRERGRTALTVAALMVGAAMVLDIGAITASFRNDLTGWVEGALSGDIYVRSPTPMRPELGRRLATVNGVDEVSPMAFRWAKLADEDQQMLLQAVDPEIHSRVASFQFAAVRNESLTMIQMLAAGDAVFISTLISDLYHLQRGDTLWLLTDRGRKGFYVAGVVVDYTADGYTLHISRRDLERYFGERMVNVFVVKTAPGIDPQVVADEIEDRFGDHYHLQTELNQEFKQRIFDLADQAFALFQVLVLIGVLVGALGVANTLLMSIFERLREIGVLRSLGMTRRQVAKMVLAEAGMMGLMGGLFGLAVGTVLSGSFIRALNQLYGYRMQPVLPPDATLASLLITLVVSQVAALYPARRAAQMVIVQAIQHE